MIAISTSFFFVADPLLRSCRAHRRRISGMLHMPHFVLDDCVIGLAGQVPLRSHRRFNIYRPFPRTWTAVGLVHVVEVTENNRIFVKSMDVHHCKNPAELVNPDHSYLPIPREP